METISVTATVKAAIDAGYHLDFWPRTTGETVRLTSRFVNDTGAALYSIMGRIGKRKGNVREQLAHFNIDEFDLAFFAFCGIVTDRLGGDMREPMPPLALMDAWLTSPLMGEIQVHDNSTHSIDKPRIYFRRVIPDRYYDMKPYYSVMTIGIERTLKWHMTPEIEIEYRQEGDVSVSTERFDAASSLWAGWLESILHGVEGD